MRPVATYKYDWMGRRVKKVVYGEPNVVTTYLYDGWRCIREYTEAGAAIRTYFYGDGIDEPVWSNGGGNIYYYHYDGLGSIIALSNPSGQVIEKYSYDVFGEPNRTSSVGNPYLFTGRRLDAETGLYYYRARYYSPTIGRFLQADPEMYSDSMNLYQYCLNDPINWTDPFGDTMVPVLPDPGWGTGDDSWDDPWPDPEDTDSDKQCPIDALFAGGWEPVPGQPGWDVRHNKPHFPGDYEHDHYRKRGRPYARKVDPRTKTQRPHGKGISKDVPDKVIEDATRNSIIIIVIGGVLYVFINVVTFGAAGG